MQQTAPGSPTRDLPVDDATYNLLQVLTSKLGAIDAYRTYAEDMNGRDAELFDRLIEEDSRHAT